MLLCHLYRYLTEIREEEGTAKRSSAKTETADHFSLITNTYLAKLYSCSEYRCKILYKIAEINSSRGSKIEEELCVIERILSVDKLHIKLMRNYLFVADTESFVFLFLVIVVVLDIGICSFSDYGAQRRNYLALAYLGVSDSDLAVFKSSRGLNDGVRACSEGNAVGREIVGLARRFKSYSDDVYSRLVISLCGGAVRRAVSRCLCRATVVRAVKLCEGVFVVLCVLLKLGRIREFFELLLSRALKLVGSLGSIGSSCYTVA